MCQEEIDISDDDESTQLDVHRSLKHCKESFYSKIYPFIIYGEAQPYYAIFYDKQTPKEHLETHTKETVT
jgi:hypothetical protein